MSKIELIHGDCLECMKDIPTGSVDAIITDPPYGTTACKWDSVIPFEPMWEQLERVVKPNGYIVMTASQPFTTTLIHSNIENFSHQWVWDKKMSANPLLCKKMPMKNFEDIIVFCFNYNKHDPRRKYFSKVLDYIGKPKSHIIKETNQGLDHCFRVKSKQFKNPTEDNYTKLIDYYGLRDMGGFLDYINIPKYQRTYNPQMVELDSERSIGGGVFNNDSFMGIEITTTRRKAKESYPTAIIDFSNRKGKRQHPTQKPVLLMEYLIKTYTNEGETVLDFTAGSFSTGVACLNTNRNFIGIEKDESYFAIGKKRMEDRQKELDFKSELF